MYARLDAGREVCVIFYLDMREVFPPGAQIGTICAEISGVEVADIADARAKLADYAPYFAGLEYESFFHEHYHEEGLPCRLTKL